MSKNTSETGVFQLQGIIEQPTICINIWLVKNAASGTVWHASMQEVGEAESTAKALLPNLAAYYEPKYQECFKGNMWIPSSLLVWKRAKRA